MTVNYVIPVSMVIEGIMIAVQSVAYAYNRTRLHAPIDEVFLGVASLFLLANIGWLLTFKAEGRKFDSISRIVRAIQGVSIGVTGSILIYSAVINNDVNCHLEDCQAFETKLAAGIISLLDVFFYFLTPVRFPNRNISPSTLMFQNGPYMGAHNLFYVQPPQSYLQNGQQLNMGIHYAPTITQFYPVKNGLYPFPQNRIPRITEYYVNTKNPTGILNPNYRPHRRYSSESIPSDYNNDVTFYRNRPTDSHRVPITEL